LQYSSIAGALARWFSANARDLPWRRNRQPWKSLVSEALLQQTQVARVAERFPEFMRRFPTPRSMVKAGPSAVLEAWRGLGYYRRARSLHAAAERIVAMHSGQVPSDMRALLELPGVGRYTAGAVASIVFGQHQPIVDGNVARVLSRLADRRASVADRTGQSWCWEQAAQLVKAAKDPGATNEALMELGATVCTPMQPRCGACPLRDMCGARAAGSQDEVPPPKPGAAVKRVVHHALVQIRDGRVALERRTEGLWSGLLAPPSVETLRAISCRQVQALSGASTVARAIARFDFQTTHRRVHFIVHPASFPEDRPLQWVPLRRLGSVAIASAGLQVVEAARGQGAPRAARLRA
jgi:A/G-specific adenine glycosylase